MSRMGMGLSLNFNGLRFRSEYLPAIRSSDDCTKSQLMKYCGYRANNPWSLPLPQHGGRGIVPTTRLAVCQLRNDCNSQSFPQASVNSQRPPYTCWKSDSFYRDNLTY